MPRVAKFRRSPEPMDTHWEGEWLVNDSTLLKVRKKSECTVSGSSGLEKCGSLFSARSLFGLVTGKRMTNDIGASRDAGGIGDLRVRVECLECHGAVRWWMGGLPLFMALWFSKNLALWANAGTSITWHVEMKTSSRAGASGAWSGTQGYTYTEPGPHWSTGSITEVS